MLSYTCMYLWFYLRLWCFKWQTAKTLIITFMKLSRNAMIWILKHMLDIQKKTSIKSFWGGGAHTLILRLTPFSCVFFGWGGVGFRGAQAYLSALRLLWYLHLGNRNFAFVKWRLCYIEFSVWGELDRNVQFRVVSCAWNRKVVIKFHGLC